MDTQSILLVIFLIFGSATTLFYWTKWLGSLVAVHHHSERISEYHKRQRVVCADLSECNDGSTVFKLSGGILVSDRAFLAGVVPYNSSIRHQQRQCTDHADDDFHDYSVADSGSIPNSGQEE